MFIIVTSIDETHLFQEFIIQELWAFQQSKSSVTDLITNMLTCCESQSTDHMISGYSITAVGAALTSIP